MQLGGQLEQVLRGFALVDLVLFHDLVADLLIEQDGAYVYTTEPGKREVTFTWKDSNAVAGNTSYYYVRGEQSDGEIVWVSPMWITYR